MAVARHPVARTAPPAPAIISTSRAQVDEKDGGRGNFPLILQCAGRHHRSGRERDQAQSAVTIPERHGCRWVAASVVLVAPRRLGTIIAGAAPNPRRHPIGTNKPSTSGVSHRPLPHTAPHRLLAQVEHPAGRYRMLVAVHGLAVRSASDAIRAPLTELLKPDGCRAPPRSSHRAAGARHHQHLARASG
jgi:hypothetical protein